MSSAPLRVEAEAVALDEPRARRRVEAQDEGLAKGARVAAVVLDVPRRGDQHRRADRLDIRPVDCVQENTTVGVSERIVGKKKRKGEKQRDAPMEMLKGGTN